MPWLFLNPVLMFITYDALYVEIKLEDGVAFGAVLANKNQQKNKG